MDPPRDKNPKSSDFLTRLKQNSGRFDPQLRATQTPDVRTRPKDTTEMKCVGYGPWDGNGAEDHLGHLEVRAGHFQSRPIIMGAEWASANVSVSVAFAIDKKPNFVLGIMGDIAREVEKKREEQARAETAGSHKEQM